MSSKKKKSLITKGRYELGFRGTKCLNCGHVLNLSDKYCPSCGQANSTKKLVLKDFLDEFFSSLINYDSKLLKTLYTMLLKPGTITKDYINGKRISYTNPFRFLFSLAFLYFLLVTYSNNISNLDDLKLGEKFEQTGPLSFSYNTDKKKDSTNFEQPLDIIYNELDSVRNTDRVLKNETAALDSLNHYIREGIAEKGRLDSLFNADPKAYYAKMVGKKEGVFFEKMEFFWKLLRRDSIQTLENAQEKYAVDQNWNTKIAFNGSQSALRAIARPGSWLNDTIGKLPFVIFLFLPVFTIFLFMVYIRKKYTYTDHLIFSFHNQSLLFILLILSYIIDTLLGWATAGIFLVIFAIYLFQAMRKFYGQGIFKTIIKYVFLNSVFAFLAFIVVILLFTGSAFTY